MSIMNPQPYDNWRAPVIPPNNELVFDEPGRILTEIPGRQGAVDCVSHHFRLIKPEFGQYALMVKHGGGDETFPLGFDSRLIDGFAQMSSDNRFVMFWAIIKAHHKSAEQSAGKVNAHWQRAAAEKRIKTRKMPGRNEVKVWIEPAKIG